MQNAPKVQSESKFEELYCILCQLFLYMLVMNTETVGCFSIHCA